MKFIKAHRYLFCAAALLSTAFLYTLLFPVRRGGGGALLVLLAIVAAVAMFLFSVLVEFPRSHFKTAKVLGAIAWAAMLLAALLTGWQRWVD